MSTVPDVGVCCKVTIRRFNGLEDVRCVDDGTLAEVIEDALWVSKLDGADADGFTITVKREGHDA
jgi:hypothetical protein